MRFNHSDFLWTMMIVSPGFVPFSVYLSYYQSGVNKGLSGARETLLFSVLIFRATDTQNCFFQYIYIQIQIYINIYIFIPIIHVLILKLVSGASATWLTNVILI